MKLPKTYLVKIDRKSIKPNPLAGQKSMIEHINTEGELFIRGPHKSLEEEFDFVKMTGSRMSLSPKEEFSEEATYVFFVPAKDFPEDFFDKLRERFGRKMSFNLKNNFQEIDFLIPAPPYLYEYRPTKVKCSYCGSKFLHTELESDGGDDGDTYVHSDTVCPKCGEWECCALKFEDFERIALKKLKLPKLVIG